jgi:hypothetical protein
MQPGDKVVVRWGVRALTGRIQTIEPVAAALPKEFQKAFKPVEREQILRVQLDQTADMPPLFAKVRLRDAEIVPAMLHRLAHAVGL